MTIIYEINPPKIDAGLIPTAEQAGELLGTLRQRVSEIANYCGGLHITESVLGTSRLSPIITARALKKLHPNLAITVSMRVIDKDIGAAERYFDEAASAGLEGVLVLMGDPPRDGRPPSGLVPSAVARHLRGRNHTGSTKIFLSIPSEPDYTKIRKKIDARPAGFITQVIRSAGQARRIYDELYPMGFHMIPIILLPSEGNLASAKFLNLDWSGYEGRLCEFIREVRGISGDVLITSPNDFGLAKDILGRL